jgi:hypothetical protein
MTTPKTDDGERFIFEKDGKFYVFVSEHPLEERTIELTDDYRGPDGKWILPEPIAWDGVKTCPGVFIEIDDDEGA